MQSKPNPAQLAVQQLAGTLSGPHRAVHSGWSVLVRANNSALP